MSQTINFYLTPDLRAHFSFKDLNDEDNDQFVALTEIRWPFVAKSGKIVLMLHRDMQSNFKEKPWEVPNKRLNSHQKDIVVPIYKSHLQKAVRRRMAESAVATVNELIDLDHVTLLRRLPLIVLEDVFLYQEFPTLVWMMCYYGKFKYQMDDICVDYVRRTVAFLCQNEYKDPYPQHGVGFSIDDLSDDLSETQRDLIFAMQLRKSYGGMPCDRAMIDRYCYKWVEQFSFPLRKKSKRDIEYLNRRLPLLFMNNLGFKNDVRLTRNNFILAGIDFHPCPNMLTMILKHHPEYNNNRDIIKKLIWNNSSSLNVRSNINDNKDDDNSEKKQSRLWMKIEDTFNNVATDLRDKYLALK